MGIWQFYALAAVALLAGAAQVAVYVGGSGNTALAAGSGVSFFIGLVSLAIGNSYRHLGQRLGGPPTRPRNHGTG